MKKSICVIDDDEIYQLIVKKVIERTGSFNVYTAYQSALEALGMFRHAAMPLPDIILLDINMPEMDGWQFVDELSRHRPDLITRTNIFIVTSSIAHSDRVKSESYKEISGFLSKPLGVEKLKNLSEMSRL